MTVAEQLAAKADDALMAKLKRHVGHTLRCFREINKIGGYRIEAVSLWCETCAESILEATARMNRARR